MKRRKVTTKDFPLHHHRRDFLGETQNTKYSPSSDSHHLAYNLSPLPLKEDETSPKAPIYHWQCQFMSKLILILPSPSRVVSCCHLIHLGKKIWAINETKNRFELSEELSRAWIIIFMIAELLEGWEIWNINLIIITIVSRNPSSWNYLQRRFWIFFFILLLPILLRIDIHNIPKQFDTRWKSSRYIKLNCSHVANEIHQQSKEKKVVKDDHGVEERVEWQRWLKKS